MEKGKTGCEHDDLRKEITKTKEELRKEATTNKEELFTEVTKTKEELSKQISEVSDKLGNIIAGGTILGTVAPIIVACFAYLKQ